MADDVGRRAEAAVHSGGVCGLVHAAGTCGDLAAGGAARDGRKELAAAASADLCGGDLRGDSLLVAGEDRRAHAVEGYGGARGAVCGAGCL